ncbi:hypothetical protein Tco_1179561 [Tanacetum coccineum]
MNCMYLKFSKLYGFYMTSEVSEEGILGVYEATIACDPVDGRGSLVKFILNDQKPTGMKENLEIKLGTLLSIEGCFAIDNWYEEQTQGGTQAHLSSFA